MLYKRFKRFLLFTLCVVFVQINFAQKVSVINQKGTKIDVVNNLVTTAAIEPIIKEIGDIWFDNTTNVSKVFDGTVWKEIDPDNVTTSNTAPAVPVTGDIWFDNSDVNNLVLNIWDGTAWVNSTSNNWLTTGNLGTTASNFLGTIDDIRMQIRSNNIPLLEFGRRQTLGLTQSYPDYSNDDQPLVHLNGNGAISALQFAASGASFYKPMFFTTSNGSFRLKGSTGASDLFEIGSAGPGNDGRLEFIIGDDGNEPIVFKRYDYRGGKFYTEFFRVQGSDATENAKTRFGININTARKGLDATYNDYSLSGYNIANSTLQINGSVSKSIVTTTGNLSLTEDHHTIILGGNHTITLPGANSCEGRIYVIKNGGTFTTTISAYENEQGSSSTFIGENTIIWLQSDGANWQQVTNSGGSSGFQTLSQSGTNVTLSNSGGTISVADNDNDASNEVNTAFTSSGNTLTITDSNSALPATIVNSNVLSIASGKITSTVNGISSTPVTLPSGGNGKSLYSVTTTGANADYSYNAPNNSNNFYQMDSALPQTSIAVVSGDIVDVRVNISEDFTNDTYYDMGDLIRFYVTINGTPITGTMIETLIAGGDNKYEVAAGSLNQMFTITQTGTMVVGIEVKFADGATRVFSTNRSGVGGLQAIIYR